MELATCTFINVPLEVALYAPIQMIFLGESLAYFNKIVLTHIDLCAGDLSSIENTNGDC